MIRQNSPATSASGAPAGRATESADRVRASVGVERLADLRDHEETSAAREAEVGRLLEDSGVFSWPLVVDAGSGLILDGSHRARVLAQWGRWARSGRADRGGDGGAGFVPVQRVALDDPALRIGVWCRVVERVAPSAFESVRRRFALVADAEVGLRCHYRGETYGRADLDPVAAHGLAAELAAALAPNGTVETLPLVSEDELPATLPGADVVVVRPPALDAATLRVHADRGRLAYKATRFVLPFRVLGLQVPLDALARPRAVVESLVGESLAAPLVCLGAGLCVDRRYPERLWQPAGYRIPRTLFATPEDHARYETARRAAPVHAGAPEPGQQPCQQS